MKNSKSFSLLLFLGAILLIGACKKDGLTPCNEQICENYSSCVDDACQCKEGSWGEFCENAWRDKYIGIYSGMETIELIEEEFPTSLEISSSIQILKSDNDNILEMVLVECLVESLNFYTITLTDENNFVATAESLASTSFQGHQIKKLEGTYAPEGGGRIIFTKEYESSNPDAFVELLNGQGDFTVDNSLGKLACITIQNLLNIGRTPKEIHDELVEGGISSDAALDSLYGKMYEGGLIFHLNNDLGIGMVAATEDQSSGAVWGCSGTEIDGADGVGVGTGFQNTEAIIMACNEANIVAKLCDDLTLNDKSDWFLPSKDELNLMYTNLHANGHGGFAADVYWSSTEYDNFNAWFEFFDVGDQNVADKYVSGHVRAARIF